MALLALAGCTTGAGSAEQPAERSTSPSHRLMPTLAPAEEPVALVDGDDPSELSVGTSRALFASAPVAVVADLGDTAGLRLGVTQATRLAAPLLLLTTGTGPSATTPAASASAPTASAGTAPAATAATPTRSALPAPATATASGAARVDAVAAEVTRLRARAVLAVSRPAAAALRDHVEVPVVTDPARLPAVTPAPGDDDLAVLVRTDGSAGTDADAAAESAASASARAAGARVIPVRGSDPRADPAAITALAAHQPAHVLAVGGSFGPRERLAQRVAVALTGVQLPGGGQVLFPGRRLVALYGHPGSSALGVLGEQGLTASIARAKKIAARYDPLSTVPVVPTFEIIATTAQRDAGRDGDYSAEASVGLLEPWVDRAEKAGVYVVLDLQPGRAHLLDQAKRYTALLRRPNVGLALDPEWHLEPGQRPLEQIGGVDASEINEVSAWLADLTRRNTLPQKLLVVHQFRLSMIRHEKRLDVRHDDVRLLIHMDGQGTPALKDSTWRAVKAAAPDGVPFGWKNFYDEDHPMLTPRQTMARTPAPMMISYQ